MSDPKWTELEKRVFERYGVAPPDDAERSRRANAWRADREAGWAPEYKRARLLARQAVNAAARARLDRRLFTAGGRVRAPGRAAGRRARRLARAARRANYRRELAAVRRAKRYHLASNSSIADSGDRFK